MVYRAPRAPRSPRWLLLFALLRCEPGYRPEAPDLAGRTVAAVGGLLFLLGRALLGDVEKILEAAPDVSTGSVVGELETEGGCGERRQDPEEEQGVLDPGEHEQHGERHPEYASEREVLSALVRDVGGQVSATPVFVELLHAELDQLRLEQRPVAREVQRPAHDAEQVSRVPEGAGLRLAPELEPLLQAQQSLEVLAGPLGGALDFPDGPEPGGTVELPGEGVRFRRLL